MKERFRAILATLDQRLDAHVREIRAQGGLPPKCPVRIRIVGQLALILCEVPFPIAGTTDVDTLGIRDYWVTTQFKELLGNLGFSLDADSHLIWMPSKTRYVPFFDGDHVRVELAEPVYVIASKCKFQRKKDQRLIAEFFAVYPDARTHVEKMGIDTAWVYR